jgi:hypothetical protein
MEVWHGAVSNRGMPRTPPPCALVCGLVCLTCSPSTTRSPSPSRVNHPKDFKVGKVGGWGAGGGVCVWWAYPSPTPIPPYPPAPPRTSTTSLTSPLPSHSARSSCCPLSSGIGAAAVVLMWGQVPPPPLLPPSLVTPLHTVSPPGKGGFAHPRLTDKPQVQFASCDGLLEGGVDG